MQLRLTPSILQTCVNMKICFIGWIKGTYDQGLDVKLLVELLVEDIDPVGG